MKELKGQKYLVLKDLLAPYKSPGCMDIKIGVFLCLFRVLQAGLPHDPQLRATLPRTGVANLLGCFVHGVEATGLVFHNRVNGYA